MSIVVFVAVDVQHNRRRGGHRWPLHVAVGQGQGPRVQQQRRRRRAGTGRSRLRETAAVRQGRLGSTGDQDDEIARGRMYQIQ